MSKYFNSAQRLTEGFMELPILLGASCIISVSPLQV